MNIKREEKTLINVVCSRNVKDEKLFKEPVLISVQRTQKITKRETWRNVRSWQ